MSSSNPAGRLHQALSAALKQPNNASMGKVWANVFDVDSKDRGEVLRLALTLANQIDLAKKEVRAVSGAEHDLYLKHLEAVETAFCETSLNENLKRFASRLGNNKGTTLEALAFASDMLRRENSKGELAADERQDLLEMVEEVASAIHQADVDADLKAVLMEHVERLRRAILEYELRGREGIVETLDMNLGFALRAWPEAETEDEAGIIRKFGDWMIRCYVLVDAATGLAEIGAGAFEKMLELPPQAGP